MRRVAAIAVLVPVAAAAGCGSGAPPPAGVPSSDPSRGKELIVHYGCGSCHTIGGVSGANGKVGPPLEGFGQRQTIAGKLANTPSNLIRWIMDPQRIVPGNDMPDLGVSRDEARDVASYLYSH